MEPNINICKIMKFLFKFDLHISSWFTQYSRIFHIAMTTSIMFGAELVHMFTEYLVYNQAGLGHSAV